MDPVEYAIRESLVDGQLPCVGAFVIARRLKVAPAVVGQKADEAGIRLSRCQLGLFGYGPKSEGKHKRVVAMQHVPPRLAFAIRAAAGTGGAMSCQQAWTVAAELHISRQEVSDAAEGLRIRVKPCQLGAFK